MRLPVHLLYEDCCSVELFCSTLVDSVLLLDSPSSPVLFTLHLYKILCTFRTDGVSIITRMYPHHVLFQGSNSQDYVCATHGMHTCTQTYLNVVLVAVLYQQCSTLFLIMCLSPTLLYQNITIITVQYIDNVSYA